MASRTEEKIDLTPDKERHDHFRQAGNTEFHNTLNYFRRIQQPRMSIKLWVHGKLTSIWSFWN